MSENLHRAVMQEREVRDGIEQLALCGVSAAQIAKRTALKRATVDAALTVVGSEATKARMDDDGLTLDQAAIFAEFEGDDQATEKLTRAVSWNRPPAHVAQQLRDAAAEGAALTAGAERLRAAGLPALGPTDLPADWRSLRLDRLVSRDGEPIPEPEWPSIPGAAVVVAPEWRYPNHQAAEDSEDRDLTAGDDDPIAVFIPLWICTDPDAAGLRDRYTNGQPRSWPGATNNMDDDEAVREARRVERRRVIANNAAWRSAEAVRREWLAGFVTRKTPPAGAEALVCAALVSGDHIFTRAMQDGHRLLCTVLPSRASRTTPHMRSEPGWPTNPPPPRPPPCSTSRAWSPPGGVHQPAHVAPPGPLGCPHHDRSHRLGYIPSDVETLLITDTGPRGDGPADQDD